MKPKPLPPLMLTLAAVLFAACGGGGSASTSEPAGAVFPLTVAQSDGQQLTLQKPPSRIVSLGADATEILCAIGAGEQLVAVERFANCPLGSKTKPELDAFQPNLEAIAGFRPDLVYVWSNQGNIVEALRRLGVQVLYLAAPDSLDKTFAHILLLGRVAGRDAQAAALVESMRRRVDSIKARVADVQSGPRFFHELDNTYFTVRPDTFVGELYSLIKGQNIAAGAASAFPQLSSEAIVARDPEVIVLADGEKPAAVRQRPGWSGISAVRSGRLCEVDPDLVSRPGPRIIDGLEALYRCLYGTR